MSEKKDTKNEKKIHCQGDCIDRIVVANPLYLQYDARKEGSVRFFKTESRKEEFLEIIQTISKKSQLNVDLLSPSLIASTETEKWNDLAFINEWVNERLDLEDIYIIPPGTDLINQEIMNKYGTNHLLWNGIISIRIPAQIDPMVACYVALVPVLLPFYIYRLVKPIYNSYYFQFLYDTDNGESRMTGIYNLKSNMHRDLLKSRLFFSFKKIKRLKKHEN
ncbi:MAG: hypothetical protein V2A54_05490 [Bacteroidota bacterium]